MSAAVRGIVLTAETARILVAGSAVSIEGRTPIVVTGPVRVEGDRSVMLTHIGGHPVDELVAEADKAKAKAEMLRGSVSRRATTGNAAVDAADHLDRVADLLIDPRLVAAAHAQWAEDEERGR